MDSRWSLALWTLLFTSLTLPGAVTSHPQDGGGVRSQRGDARLLQDVLRGLEKAANFFREDFSSINVDGLFGIRVAQGTIIQSLNFCVSGTSPHCSPELYARLGSLNTTIGTMADRALPYIKAQDPDYYQSFYKTIDGPYMIAESSQSLGRAVSAPGVGTDYNEESGDRCLASLMGTWRRDGRTVPVCTVDQECLQMMTRPHQASYSITHQLLYFIMAEKNGCLDELDSLLSAEGLGSVKEFEQSLCGHIYSEMEGEVNDGHVAQLQQDLFLEQNVLCGVIGFSDFFPRSWISMVLGWQTSRGCFSMAGSLVALQAEIQSVSDQQRELLQRLEEEARDIDSAPWTSRKLMRERVMEDDCLAHKTGLGIGVLGVYQRHLLENTAS